LRQPGFAPGQTSIAITTSKSRQGQTVSSGQAYMADWSPSHKLVEMDKIIQVDHFIHSIDTAIQNAKLDENWANSMELAQD
jgi:hypothetical protein